jgi:hypothetical protein
VRTLAYANVTAACLLIAGAPASAQPAATGTDGRTFGASLALASLWDDETHLGRGPAVTAEFTVPVGGHLRAGVEAGWFGHDRDSGYLAADGHVVHVMGRATVLVGPRHWRTRPFIGGAVGLARSSGTLTFRDAFSTPSEVRSRWGLTRGAWDVHLGVRAAAGRRWVLRPELRAGAIGGTGNTDALQTPLLRLQGGVAVEWAGR